MLRVSLNEASDELQFKLQALSSRMLELAISWVPWQVRTLVEIEVPIGKVVIPIWIQRFSEIESLHPTKLHRHKVKVPEQVLAFRVLSLISKVYRTLRIRPM